MNAMLGGVTFVDFAATTRRGKERENTLAGEREKERSHCDAEEPIFWAAWRDAVRYGAMLRDYHNNRRYYSMRRICAVGGWRSRWRQSKRIGLSLMHF